MDLARLTELLAYDPFTGLLTWKVNRRGYRGIKASDIAGTTHHSSKTDRYLSIRVMVDQKWYEAHRIAWALHSGSDIPDGMHIDHINGDATDNRLANLRLASHKQNMENTKLHGRNTSGYRGVSWDSARQQWLATITHNRKQKHIGRFETKQQAVAAVMTARANLYTHYTGRELK